MFFSTDKLKFYFLKFNLSKEVPYFFLHGFTGTHQNWTTTIKGLKKPSYAIDLPGHGKSLFLKQNDKYTFDDWCDDFNQLLNYLNLNKINLCGYSMGGRLAISFAKKHPNKINSLFLESTSFGLKNEEDRNKRIKSDQIISDNILNNFSKTMIEWSHKPLFSSQKIRNKTEWDKQLNQRLMHKKRHLSKSLKIFRLGKMKYYRNDIRKFTFPIIIINGFEDKKFIEIGKDLLSLNRNSKHYIVPESNHNIHMENNNEFVKILRKNYHE